VQRLNIPLDLVRPLGPVAPVGPEGPLGPVGPVAPEGPLGPVAPAVGPVSAILILQDGQPIPISCTFFIKHVV
jgi:hypothetical protein